MSLPPTFVDELRTRLSLAQVVGRKVMWDMRKSNQAKGDWWAPCPFHQEKSASFHVDDRKGYYYCFGCHAKGDMVSFVRETENVSFMEAIEILAREAGMPMPARDPRAAEKADRRTELSAVMDEAVKFFRLQLRTGAAQAARDYLKRRGLSEEAQDRWELGFAPNSWEGLRDALTAKGITEEHLLATGLVKASDKGKRPYDVFRNRIMFPIRDARGRAIAFGGRAMDPNDNAKYLNSPETELFDKGRNLYNLGRAREAVGKGKPLIVAEGYMDVIALSEAGFQGAVAPLGTAVTEDQLRLMWRVAPEPIMALDGDKAGIRAGLRVVDLALPLLEAGNSLRFALLPEGLDPDDLIKAKGAPAMQAVLDAAKPMVDLLWQRETEGHVFDSPERRAALDKTLRAKLKAIKDPSLRAHYGDMIKELRYDLFGAKRRAPQGRGAGGAPRRAWGKPGDMPAIPTASARASILASSEGAARHLREAVILATVISTPGIIPEFEAELERMDCSYPDHARLRDALMSVMPSPELRDHVARRAGPETVEALFRLPVVTIAPAVRRPGDLEQARLTLAEELAKLRAETGLQAEVAEAVEELDGPADEALTWRLREAAESRNRAARSESEDRAEYDTAPNGLRLARSEREEFERILNLITVEKRHK
jgi:DNA primase